jgi:hypothetical protein
MVDAANGDAALQRLNESRPESGADGIAERKERENVRPCGAGQSINQRGIKKRDFRREPNKSGVDDDPSVRYELDVVVDGSTGERTSARCVCARVWVCVSLLSLV